MKKYLVAAAAILMGSGIAVASHAMALTIHSNNQYGPIAVKAGGKVFNVAPGAQVKKHVRAAQTFTVNFPSDNETYHCRFFEGTVTRHNMKAYIEAENETSHPGYVRIEQMVPGSQPQVLTAFHKGSQAMPGYCVVS